MSKLAIFELFIIVGNLNPKLKWFCKLKLKQKLLYWIAPLCEGMTDSALPTAMRASLGIDSGVTVVPRDRTMSPSLPSAMNFNISWNFGEPLVIIYWSTGLDIHRDIRSGKSWMFYSSHAMPNKDQSLFVIHP